MKEQMVEILNDVANGNKTTIDAQKELLHLFSVSLPSKTSIRNQMVTNWGMEGRYSYEAAQSILNMVRKSIASCNEH